MKRSAPKRLYLIPVLSKALEGPSATLARIPKDGTHAPLLAAMKVPPLAEVAMAAIRVEGKAVALVLADEVGDTMTATKRLEEVAQLYLHQRYGRAASFDDARSAFEAAWFLESPKVPVELFATVDTD